MLCLGRKGLRRGPHGDEVQSVAQRLLAYSDENQRYALNSVTDPCPELTRIQLQTMKGCRLVRCLGRHCFLFLSIASGTWSSGHQEAWYDSDNHASPLNVVEPLEELEWSCR